MREHANSPGILNGNPATVAENRGASPESGCGVLELHLGVLRTLIMTPFSELADTTRA